MTKTISTELCPTCGSRVSEGATKCLVCGTDLTQKGTDKAKSVVQSNRMPEVTLSLPVALALVVIFLGIGAGLVFFTVRQQPEIVVPPTETSTPTVTSSPTLTPTPETPTPTNTPEPTATPLSYVVQEGDQCISIAAFFQISVQSIVSLNNLDTNCTIFSGDVLLIPHPTPTPTALPSATLNPTEAYAAECEKVIYNVQSGDTLSTISANYQVPMESIRRWNNLSSDVVFEGLPLTIPLCERDVSLTGGPTSTPTPAPPYPAPSLLLPADGAAFTLSSDVITLQWASVGALRENESYIVIVVDATSGEENRLVDYVTDTKFIMPTNFLSSLTGVHVIYWQIGTVRQVGTDEDGLPVYEEAGALSERRGFGWSREAVSTPSP
ncbi:MAG TPA: LysM peptidoglycan-binding domain-containing protein [Anaerolineales bacterium]|nr:LysM peptidoglycan-binding domain-containing protein [Anaerolineales bacterium]